MYSQNRRHGLLSVASAPPASEPAVAAIVCGTTAAVDTGMGDTGPSSVGSPESITYNIVAVALDGWQHPLTVVY